MKQTQLTKNYNKMSETWQSLSLLKLPQETLSSIQSTKRPCKLAEVVTGRRASSTCTSPTAQRSWMARDTSTERSNICRRRLNRSRASFHFFRNSDRQSNNEGYLWEKSRPLSDRSIKRCRIWKAMSLHSSALFLLSQTALKWFWKPMMSTDRNWFSR